MGICQVLEQQQHTAAKLKYLISLPNGRTSLPLKEGKLCHLGQTDPLQEGGSVSGLLHRWPRGNFTEASSDFAARGVRARAKAASVRVRMPDNWVLALDSKYSVPQSGTKIL